MHIEKEALERSLEQLRRSRAESATTLEKAIEQLADAVTTMFGLTGSGLMLVDEDSLLHSVLATDDLGWALEHAQEEAGEGPCVDTLVHGHVVSTDDVGNDDRWPALGARLRGTGLGGVLGVPVVLGGVTVGALNVFVDRPHQWDDSDRHALTTFGSILESMLTTALFAEQRDQLAGQLQEALDSRVTIERSVGVLMGRDGMDAVAAFNKLRSEARSKRQKVYDLAGEILAEYG